MFVQRRLHFNPGDDRVGRSCRVIMPMRVDGAPTVAVRVDVACQDNGITAQRRIEWVILRCSFVVVLRSVNLSVFMGTMVVLGELGLVTVRVNATIDDD